jgi:hypothetical protein
MQSVLKAFNWVPALVWPMLFYMVLALFGTPNAIATGEGPALSIPVPSGDILKLSWREVFLIWLMTAAAIDLLGQSQSDTKSMTRLAVGMALGIVGLILVLVVRGFGEMTFGLLVLAAFINVSIGAAIAIRAAQRDVTVEGRQDAPAP